MHQRHNKNNFFEFFLEKKMMVLKKFKQKPGTEGVRHPQHRWQGRPPGMCPWSSRTAFVFWKLVREEHEQRAHGAHELHFCFWKLHIHIHTNNMYMNTNLMHTVQTPQGKKRKKNMYKCFYFFI